MQTNLILSVLFCGILSLSACGETTKIKEVPVVETRTVEVPRPAPIVPSVDQLRLRKIEWIVITPENVDEVFAELDSDSVALFALTADGYEALSLNISDIRSILQQQKRVIAVYRDSFR